MRFSHLFAFFAIFFAWVLSAHASVEFEIYTGAGSITGSNIYETENVSKELDPWERDPYSPVSAMEFPLGVYVATLDAKITMDKFSVSGKILQNINDKARDMKADDWGVPFWDNDGDEGPGWYVGMSNGEYLLDTHSYSKSTVDVMIWEANISYWIFSYHHESINTQSDLFGYLGIGYDNRSFEYECSLIRQLSPSRIPGYDYIGDGSVGTTYDVSYSIPYIELTLSDRTDKLSIDMNFGYSPHVRARDNGTHLAKIPGPIYVEGDCTGISLKYSAGIQYDFTPRWSVKVILDRLFIRAKGEQDNIINAGSDGLTSWDAAYWTTDEQIINRESYLTLNVVYRFGLSR